MTPSARIKASIDILEALSKSRVPMDITIGDYMRYRRYIGSKDRSEIAERTYNVVRAQARLSWWIDKLGVLDSPRYRVLLWLSLGERLESKRLKALFDGSKYGAASLNELELALITSLDHKPLEEETMPEQVRVECPPQYETVLRSYFKESFSQELGAMLQGASLDMRVNIWRADIQKVQDYLNADGVETDRTKFSPWGLRAKGKAYLSKTKAWQKGWVEIQDEGSQLIAYLSNVSPGMQVLDYCAGAGGKTLALAACMKNKGRLVATDIDKRRLERGRPRFKKAGLHDIIEVRALEDEKNRKWLRRQKGAFDLVLIDAPCSGTGTWRRNPDMRWNTYGPSLEELVDIQEDILNRAAKTVKPEGKLVYATCSLLPEENERQIEQFLLNHGEFEVLPINRAWPDKNAPCEGDFMRLTPYRHDTDGFFAAVLQRHI